MRLGLPLLDIAQAWRDVGIQLVQYRDKTADRETIRKNALVLRAIFPVGEAFLLLNDHPELASEVDFDGAHVGQTDMAIELARQQLGPERILGVSTHTADQALAANGTEADYLAVGPVFTTTTKADTASVVGMCGVHAARAVVRKPLVAIGGIGLEQVRDVLCAGADAVALISALLPRERGLHAVTKRAQDILAALK